MSYDSIISCEETARHCTEPGWLLIDCRYSMADPLAGHRDYMRKHLPGAVYADLGRDLSGAVIPGVTGRHPLPAKDHLVKVFGRLGITVSTQVVVYDEQAGQMAAARLWWLLQWAGHAAAAVLDGGIARWESLGLPLESGDRHPTPAVFSPAFTDRLVVTARDVEGALHNPAFVLADSRAADRYRGENETIDPVAGHIPGAVSVPFAENIAEDGMLKPAPLLRDRFTGLLGNHPAGRTIFYCGSGVTAAQNVLSYRQACGEMPLLYVGSWSDWITDRARPVVQGDSR